MMDLLWKQLTIGAASTICLTVLCATALEDSAEARLSHVHMAKGNPRPTIAAETRNGTSLSLTREGQRYCLTVRGSGAGKTGLGHFALNPDATVAKDRSAEYIGTGWAYHYALKPGVVRQHRASVRRLVKELDRRASRDRTLPYPERKQFKKRQARRQPARIGRDDYVTRRLGDLPYRRAFPRAPEARAFSGWKTLAKRTTGDLVQHIARRLERAPARPLTEEAIYRHYLGDKKKGSESYETLRHDLYTTLLTLEGMGVIGRKNSAYRRVAGGSSPTWSVNVPPAASEVSIVPGRSWKAAVDRVQKP